MEFATCGTVSAGRKERCRERAHLAEHLIASLDEDGEIEEAWAAEVERRIDEIEGLHVQMIPAAEVIARARELLK